MIFQWPNCYNARVPVHLLSFVRSDTPSHLTPEGWEELRAYGVQRIIDLRTEGERQGRPYETLLPVAHLPMLPMDASTAKLHGQATSRGEEYLLWLQTYPERVAAILRAIEPYYRTLLHCQTGKDRTGVICALLQDLIGVRGDVIAEDYALSEGLLWPWFEKEQMDPPLAKPEYMLTFLSLLHEAYGGAEGYFRAIGLSEREILERKVLFLRFKAEE